ncbi:MAG: hypothetical protein R3E89_16705 [Thiolinea sp.]
MKKSIVHPLLFSALLTLLAGLPVQAAEPEVIETTTISLRGQPHYPPEFTHFAYANPAAPQAGTLVDWVQGTFDNFNPYATRGDASQGSRLLYDDLMASSSDDLNAYYPLIAKRSAIPAIMPGSCFIWMNALPFRMASRFVRKM